MEQLLAEDEFIQEAQAQSPALRDYLCSPTGLHGLVYYLSSPQRHTDEAKAFRFPYMCCEALCCNVNPILDALTARDERGREHMLQLFSCVAPELRLRIRGVYDVDTSAELPADQADPFLIAQHHSNVQPADVRPYLAGYFSKVVAMLCKKRPTAMVRFLDRTPGIAAGLACHIENGAIAALVSTLLDLPWDSANGMGTLRLSRADAPDSSLPDLLLGIIASGLDAASVGVETGSAPGQVTLTHAQATAAANAADVICTALHASHSAAPHAKFAVEGYNAHHMDKARRGPGSSSNSSNGGGGSDHDTTGGAGAGADDADADQDDDTKYAAALSHTNLQLDQSFSSATVDASDRVQLRLLKSLRDGKHAAIVVALAQQAASILNSYQSRASQSTDQQQSSDAGAAVPGTVQTACDAAFRVLASVLDACAYGYRNQAVFSFDVNGNGIQLQQGAQQAQQQLKQPLPPCPHILTLLTEPSVLNSMSGYLQSLSMCASETVSAVMNASSVSALPRSPAPPAAAASPATRNNSGTNSNSATSTVKQKAPLPDADVLPGYAPAPSYRLAPKLGIAGLSLAKCLSNLTRCGWSAVDAAGVKCGVFASLLDTMVSFPWHSILHKVVTDAVVDAIRFGSEAIKRSLFFECRLLTRIVAGCKLAQLPARMSEYGKRTSRVGYTGHLIAIASVILSAHSRGQITGQAAHLLTSHSGWWTLVHHEIAIANIAHGVLIGGMAPDTKASGNVGAAADATGAPKGNVDGVVGLDLDSVKGKGMDGDRFSDDGNDSDDDDEEGGSRHDGGGGGSRPRALSGSDDDEDDGDGGVAARRSPVHYVPGAGSSGAGCLQHADSSDGDSDSDDGAAGGRWAAAIGAANDGYSTGSSGSGALSGPGSGSASGAGSGKQAEAFPMSNTKSGTTAAGAFDGDDNENDDGSDSEQDFNAAFPEAVGADERGSGGSGSGNAATHGDDDFAAGFAEFGSPAAGGDADFGPVATVQQPQTASSSAIHSDDFGFGFDDHEHQPSVATVAKAAAPASDDDDWGVSFTSPSTGAAAPAVSAAVASAPAVADAEFGFGDFDANDANACSGSGSKQPQGTAAAGFDVADFGFDHDAGAPSAGASVQQQPAGAPSPVADNGFAALDEDDSSGGGAAAPEQAADWAADFAEADQAAVVQNQATDASEPAVVADGKAAGAAASADDAAAGAQVDAAATSAESAAASAVAEFAVGAAQAPASATAAADDAAPGSDHDSSGGATEGADASASTGAATEEAEADSLLPGSGQLDTVSLPATTSAPPSLRTSPATDALSSSTESGSTMSTVDTHGQLGQLSNDASSALPESAGDGAPAHDAPMVTGIPGPAAAVPAVVASAVDQTVASGYGADECDVTGGSGDGDDGYDGDASRMYVGGRTSPAAARRRDVRNQGQRGADGDEHDDGGEVADRDDDNGGILASIQEGEAEQAATDVSSPDGNGTDHDDDAIAALSPVKRSEVLEEQTEAEVNNIHDDNGDAAVVAGSTVPSSSSSTSSTASIAPAAEVTPIGNSTGTGASTAADFSFSGFDAVTAPAVTSAADDGAGFIDDAAFDGGDAAVGIAAAGDDAAFAADFSITAADTAFDSDFAPPSVVAVVATAGAALQAQPSATDLDFSFSDFGSFPSDGACGGGGFGTPTAAQGEHRGGGHGSDEAQQQQKVQQAHVPAAEPVSHDWGF